MTHSDACISITQSSIDITLSISTEQLSNQVKSSQRCFVRVPRRDLNNLFTNT